MIHVEIRARERLIACGDRDALCAFLLPIFRRRRGLAICVLLFSGKGNVAGGECCVQIWVKTRNLNSETN